MKNKKETDKLILSIFILIFSSLCFGLDLNEFGNVWNKSIFCSVWCFILANINFWINLLKK